MSRNTKLIIWGIVILALFAPLTFSGLLHNAIDAIKTIWGGIASTGIFNQSPSGG